ncbi:hypothetical protein M413DRAFT_32768 [Hebeloma cylindrosporum]|uniref:Uncharacterized protein n=1 Tax=Hebeloma cylindrosporum TaxID=76867 RepID=A0A0C3BUT1_HEBCY|nr:hypothetical protein M413DRAFT_32768 [Hebeloma cylindrosporum h7]
MAAAQVHTCLPPFYVRLGPSATEAHLRRIRTNLLVISEQVHKDRRHFDTTWGITFVQSLAQCLLNLQFSAQYLLHNPSELELFRVTVQAIRNLYNHHRHYRHRRSTLPRLAELAILEQIIQDAESEILDFIIEFAFLFSQKFIRFPSHPMPVANAFNLLLALKKCSLEISNTHSWTSDALEGLALAQEVSHTTAQLEIDNKFLDEHCDASQILIHTWQNEYDAVAYAQQGLFKGTLCCSRSCVALIKLIRDHLTWCTEGRPSIRADNGGRSPPIQWSVNDQFFIEHASRKALFHIHCLVQLIADFEYPKSYYDLVRKVLRTPLALDSDPALSVDLAKMVAEDRAIDQAVTRRTVLPVPAACEHCVPSPRHLYD